MNKAAYQHRIALSLGQVAHCRDRLARDAVLAGCSRRLKRYQSERLRATYADLQAQPRYRSAVDFFTQDLYGERDYSDRDAGIERIVPAIGRLFPLEALATLDAALALYALTESLDLHMCEASAMSAWDAASYHQAWLVTGREAERHEQLALVMQVGGDLDKLVKLPVIGLTLKAMAGPARLAGLTELHGFLLRGFAAFKQLHGAQEFLALIESREIALINELFQLTVKNETHHEPRIEGSL